MSISLCRVLIATSAILSVTVAATDAYCKDGDQCPMHAVEVTYANSLFQSTAGNAVPLRKYTGIVDDEEDLSTHQAQLNVVDDSTFYFSVCLDILILLVVAHGWKRYRNGDHLKLSRHSGPVSKSASKRPAVADPQMVLALHHAVREGNVERCAELLDTGAAVSDSLSLLDEEDFWGCTALHIAADVGSCPLVSLFLERGAKVSASDTWKSTPLHFAARAGDDAVCKLLISQGAAVNAVDGDERTPLHIAALRGHEAACELLLDEGGALNGIPDTDIPPLLNALIARRLFQQVMPST